MNYSRLKQLASDRQITLKGLAESIGLTAQGFHGYVRKNTMPIDKLEAIAGLLNVRLLDLLTESSESVNDKIVVNESGLQFEEKWKEKYYSLLEKYNSCLEEKEAISKVTKRKDVIPNKPVNK